MGPLTVMLAGSEQQQRAYLPPFCDAQGGYLRHGSLAFAERTGGYTLGEISATVRMDRSTPSGDTSWIVNGTKRDVIHGAASSPRVILARLDGQPGPHGLCALVVPDETPGLRITHDDNKLGLIAAPSASYTLEEARLPADSLLGTRPSGRGTSRDALPAPACRRSLRYGPRRPGVRGRLRPSAHRLWPAHCLLPGHRFHVRRNGHEAGCRAPAALASCDQLGQRHRGGNPGPRSRGGPLSGAQNRKIRHHRYHPDSGRSWLYARPPG